MLQGSYVALVTPFKNQEIDYTALGHLLDFHLQQKTDGVLLLGTTAETPTLSKEEKEQILLFGIEKLSGKLPVMVGTGTNNLDQTIAQTVRAKQIGADTALVITPYYTKPTQKGLFEYFSKVVEKTDMPIVIYNVPGRTGVNISASTTVALAKAYPNRIVAIKEASGNIVQASEIVRDAPHDFSVLSGEDALNMPLMAVGMKGTVSVTANVVPAMMHDLISSCLEGNWNKALKLHLQLLELNQMMFIETSPIPAKTALHAMGLIDLDFRLPMTTLLSENRDKLHISLRKYGLIS